MNTQYIVSTQSLLLEKKIGQFVSTSEITFVFEIHRTRHAFIRSTRDDINDYNDKEITNGEIKYFIEATKKQISEGILTGLIKDQTRFIIKSKEKELAVAINPVHNIGYYWSLFVITVFRESEDLQFRTSENQYVIEI